MANHTDGSERSDQTAHLEQAFMTEFLENRGLSWQAVRALPDAERHEVLREASKWASNRLAEVESRAHLVHDLHHND